MLFLVPTRNSHDFLPFFSKAIHQHNAFYVEILCMKSSIVTVFLLLHLVNRLFFRYEVFRSFDTFRWLSWSKCHPVAKRDVPATGTSSIKKTSSLKRRNLLTK